MADSDLGAFLRARREAVSPSEVGLPVGSRRRTPGLRRAEVAMLAGISVEYLTRIEQGRDKRPSAQVLNALADALRMTQEERRHLQKVASAAYDNRCLGASLTHVVTPGVQAVLDQLEPMPALVVNRLGDVLSATSGFRALAEPLGLFDPGHANLPRFVFTHPRAREAFGDWACVADEWAERLKVESMRPDAATRHFLVDLRRRGGPDVVDRLAAPAMPHRPGITRWLHPRVGPLRLEQVELAVTDLSDQRLISHVPADEQTRAAVEALVRPQPVELRAVAGED
ncbi:helix-turn-helix transcriptional regulator [Thermocrispum municipale]|uniref:helix-turn-helix transcriptional regulator n=1 Tax=Thermocrispum municipale TaxID=37926 RepID=UPI000405DCD2|nr:helix-turn-helix transcriptional regulator [Thermocrispum municipale]